MFKVLLSIAAINSSKISSQYYSEKESEPFFGPALSVVQVDANVRIEVRKLYLRDITGGTYGTSEHYILTRFFDPTDVPYATPRVVRKLDGHTVSLKQTPHSCDDEPVIELRYKAGANQTILELLTVNAQEMETLVDGVWASNFGHLEWLDDQTLEVKNTPFPSEGPEVIVEKFKVNGCSVTQVDAE